MATLMVRRRYRDRVEAESDARFWSRVYRRTVIILTWGNGMHSLRFSGPR